MSDRLMKRIWLFLFALIALCLLFTSQLSAETPAEEIPPAIQPYYVELVGQSRPQADSKRLIEATYNGTVLQQLDGPSTILIVDLSAENAQKIQSQRHASIGIVEPVPTYHLASETYPYSHDLMQSRAAWDADQDDQLDTDANAGSGMRVCIIDTGIASTHKDFAGTSITGNSQITGEDWQYDPSGHGTHIGGIIAARLQGEGLVGFAPQANLHLVKMFDYGENWVAGQSNLAAALLSCQSAGAKIVNLSIASCTVPSQLEQQLLEHLFINEDMLFVSSAGNSNNECQQTSRAYPASFDSVISVGAVDETLASAPFSQQNDQVELVAPGVDVLGLWPTPNNGGIHQFSVTNNFGTIYTGEYVAQSAYGTAQAELIDGGMCDTLTAQPTWQNNIVLCERGSNTFVAKVAATETNGAAGTILYNNVAGAAMVIGLGSDNSQRPVIALTNADGIALRAQLGTTVTLTSELGIFTGAGGYRMLSGTSQAAAHIAATAAVVWGACPQLTNHQIRTHLTGIAVSPSQNRSDLYGFGIVQLNAAVNALYDGIDTYNGVVQLGSEASNAECVGPSAVQIRAASAQNNIGAGWLLASLMVLSAATLPLVISERKNAD